MDLVKDLILIFLPVSLIGFTAFTYEFVRMYSSSQTRDAAMKGLKASKRGLIIAGVASLCLFIGLLYFDIVYQQKKDSELNETIKTTIETTINEAIDRQTQAILNAIDKQSQMINNAIQQGGLNGSQSGNTTK